MTLEQARLWCRKIDERRRWQLAMSAQASRLAFGDKESFADFIARLTGEGQPASSGIGTKRADEEQSARIRAEREARQPNPAIVEALRKKREAETGT